jgi:hypothetical protein
MCFAYLRIGDIHRKRVGNSIIQCSELGRKFSVEFKKEYMSEFSIWVNPEFYYNNAMATCLVYNEVVDGKFSEGMNDIWYHRRITDIYSNKVIAYQRSAIKKTDPTKNEIPIDLSNVGDTVNLSRAKFDQAKMELFRNISDRSVFTLYRSSTTDEKMRIHVATFDASEKEEYNRENCGQSQLLFQNQPGVKTKFWCEKGRFKK